MTSKGRDRLSWEETAMHLAINIADYRSQDPNTQVGACIIKHNGEILLGYNGAPAGIEIPWNDREEKRKRVIHAEVNVLMNIQRGDARIFAVTHLPCLSCLAVIAQKGIKVVYYKYTLPNYNYSEVIDIGTEEFGIQFIKL